MVELAGLEPVVKGWEDVALSFPEIRRYGRHLIMPEVGMKGQKRLKAAKALVVGAGGLGSPVSLYLTAAGVGRIGIVDFDNIDETNLQRQVIFTTEDVDRPKVEVAKERLRRLNPHVDVVTYNSPIDSSNALNIIKDYDIVIDATDNFPTRYLLNDACVFLGKPLVYGSIFRFDGQVSVFYAGKGPCYRCLYPEPPPPGLVPSCAEGGVLGVLPGIIGSLQANEAIKLILGVGRPLIGKLLLVDALSMNFRELSFQRDRNCPVCGDNPTIRELIDYEAFCGVRVTGEELGASFSVTPEQFKEMVERGERVELIDVREPVEWEICHIPGAKLIPLGQLTSRLHEIDQTKKLVVYCHTGQRSSLAVKLLRDIGISRAFNLAGGIDAYSERIDPSIPRY
ncbi:MAG: molybdopterin-synthase adenylyltransferase MoeB [Thaumarchaeota archaeon]|nr:molybdopterin-synthase adenylyltransferase MoeB [Candidatus Calditenuaceae archaeon]MDW8186824.1 molybdopterin-synthase adenylyltransferase MoeB [Nitrososphaerota archaeon]